MDGTGSARPPSATRSSAGSARSRRSPWSQALTERGRIDRDDRRRGQRRAGAEAGSARRRDGLGQPDQQGGGRHRAARGPVLDAAAGGRRGPADRAQHPPAGAPLPDEDRLRGLPDPGRGDLRLRVPVPAPPTHRRRLPDDRDPVVRARPGAERGPAVPRAPAARAGRVRGPRGLAIGIGSLLSFFLVDNVFGGSSPRAEPRRRRR